MAGHHLRSCYINIGDFFIWQIGAQSPNHQILCIANISAFTVINISIIYIRLQNDAHVFRLPVYEMEGDAA